jgi:hypothetical protein
MANSPFVFLEELEEGGYTRVSQRTKILGRHRYSSNFKKFPSSETVCKRLFSILLLS